MAFFTEFELRTAARQLTESRNLTRYANTAEKTVFLSHSHEDRELAEGLKKTLGQMGINLYIDWLDNKMPPQTNRETAEALKNKITEMNFFMILATKTALTSRWVPWEIGIADGRKPHQQILLVPVADPSGEFHGSEYLRLYNYIEPDFQGIKVFKPNQRAGISLTSHLRGY